MKKNGHTEWDDEREDLDLDLYDDDDDDQIRSKKNYTRKINEKKKHRSIDRFK